MTTAGEPWLLDVEDVAGTTSNDWLRALTRCAAALDPTAQSTRNYAQNQQRNTRRLTLPVLAIGGGHWLAEHGRRSHHAGADLGGLIS
jgi:hypothetical protein